MKKIILVFLWVVALQLLIWWVAVVSTSAISMNQPFLRLAHFLIGCSLIYVFMADLLTRLREMK